MKLYRRKQTKLKITEKQYKKIYKVRNLNKIIISMNIYISMNIPADGAYASAL